MELAGCWERILNGRPVYFCIPRSRMFQTDDKFLEIRDLEAPYPVRRHCSPCSPPSELETYSCLLWTALCNVVLRVSFSPCESSSQDKFLSFQPAFSAAILPLSPSVRFGLRPSSGRIHVAQQQDARGSSPVRKSGGWRRPSGKASCVSLRGLCRPRRGTYPVPGI